MNRRLVHSFALLWLVCAIIAQVNNNNSFQIAFLRFGAGIFPKYTPRWMKVAASYRSPSRSLARYYVCKSKLVINLTTLAMQPCLFWRDTRFSFMHLTSIVCWCGVYYAINNVISGPLDFELFLLTCWWAIDEVFCHNLMVFRHCRNVRQPSLI